MGLTNHGTQTIVYQYFADATASIWGKRLLGIMPTGIYSGCRVEILSGTSLQLSSMVVEIRDLSNQVSIRTSGNALISTATLDSGSVSSSTPYLVLRWAYASTALNYFEVHAIASLASRQQYDLVVGKMTFTGGVLVGFDYADRSHPRTADVELRVESMTPASMYLLVRGGRYPTGNTNYLVPETQIGPFVAPAAPYSRIDLVYMSGGIPTILQGTPAVTPSTPNYGGRMVLAEVTLVNSDTALSWNRIIDVRSSAWPVAIPDGVSIEHDSSGQLSVVDPFFGRRYDSDWFAVTKNTSYTKVHGLGSQWLMFTILFAPDLGGSPDLTKVTQVAYDEASSGNAWGASVQDITNTQVVIRTGNDGVAIRLPSTAYVSGYYKVLALKVS